MTDKDFQAFMIKHMTKLSDDVTDLRQNLVRVEFTLAEKIDDLFDGYKTMNDKLDEHSSILVNHTERLQRIEDKVGKHDIQIQVLDKTKSNKRNVK
ncbi:MAG: hypothetical protein CVU90_01670 [Firmicutes bacterium HGW-Firmicutes-15]|nr:MAG: hypothetical protein CVU90_01670 [Firmicutes bacterium HGW-Firmicutes-15]